MKRKKPRTAKMQNRAKSQIAIAKKEQMQSRLKNQ
jgi:hypothetical protein